MEALVLKILSVLAIVNIVLSAVDSVLGKIVEATKPAADSKLLSVEVIVHKIASALQSVVQFLSANKPNAVAAPAPAAVEAPKA